ncbi:MFS transporter [Marivibrio halodurans]|uniref:2-oxoglutarate dehydrogenase E1 component n=1 Tax=Marivibrio halodurans TaxID=2039722 RepID=A0A8J7V0T4_9PROT|nr:alpha-ketoacid dehydrogenase subunit alpha/beta [Marivibrio halodurans]MBP5857116.1 MFS transporter [Marivibrio halodurans]
MRIKDIERFRVDVPWGRLKTTDKDWAALSGERHRGLYEQLMLIRRFEEKLLDLKAEDLVHGPVHTSCGQEGGAVGAMAALATQDRINGTHRMHHQFLAKVLNSTTPADYDPIAIKAFPDPMQQSVTTTLSEIMGLNTGYCGGRGGSMHLRLPEAGVLGSNAIVGGNIPHAAGYALADKVLGRDAISVAFFGDGAMMMGTAYESINLAAIYGLPVVFFVENNLYAVSTHVDEQTREARLSSRGASLGVPSFEVDGMDLVAVNKAMRTAREWIAKEGGPVLIEAKTYRFLHQQGPLKGSNFGYRDKDEEAAWNERDPALRYPEALKERGILSEEQAGEIDARVRIAVDRAADAVLETAPGENRRRIIPSLWPDTTTVESGIRGDLSELKGQRTAEIGDFAQDALKSMKFADVIAQAMLRNMERDETIIIMGEDVHRLRGGTAGATRGIVDRFPERLYGTPICENGFTGLGLGAALNGLRTVVEIMYPDFCLVAADQLFNQVAKVRHMFNGGFSAPVLVRSRVSAGAGYGSQHSMDASGLFALYPGWRIVAPSTPFDYIGLLNSALRCDDPVLVVEHTDLYQTEGPVPEQDWDYCIPFGKAAVRREGAEVTVLAALTMVGDAIAGAENAGIDAEVIDLRTLDPLGLDWETIEASVRKTNRLVIAEQTTHGTGIGARIAQEAQERLFDWLDHEVVRVAGTQSSPVVSKVLERAALAGQTELEHGLRRAMGRG